MFDKIIIMQKQLLTDVVVIRPILIVLLVFYHAFAIYGGAWEPIDGYPSIRLYWWMDWLSYSFMLETFVFISGYVFGYQVRIKGESMLEAKRLIPKKIKRLVIPSILFSLLYIILLGDITQHITITAYEVINGKAHMWFLPMLFWCFVGIWFIEKMQIQVKHVIFFLFIISVCSYDRLPFRIGNTMYYMLFFYVGYILQRKKVRIQGLYTLRAAMALILAFAIIFPSTTILRDSLSELGGVFCAIQYTLL